MALPSQIAPLSKPTGQASASSTPSVVATPPPRKPSMPEDVARARRRRRSAWLARPSAPRSARQRRPHRRRVAAFTSARPLLPVRRTLVAPIVAGADAADVAVARELAQDQPERDGAEQIAANGRQQRRERQP